MFVDPSYSNYSHEAHAEERRLSITFIIIVVGFIICWTPIFVYLNYASVVKDKSTIPTLINPIGESNGYAQLWNRNKLMY